MQPLEWTNTATPSTHSFRCDSCGASMSYDASARALRCPFCGSEAMTQQVGARTLRPVLVVPFRVQPAQVDQMLREWLKQGFWRPGDAAEGATIGEVRQVYVPFWSFSAETKTNWTGDSSSVPFGARGNWYPQGGQIRGSYSHLLVSASSILMASEVHSIMPFDLREGVAPEQIDLDNVCVEEFRLPKKFARPLAMSQLESLETASCAQRIPGRNRNVRVNVLVEEMTSVPLLLPMWIMVYRYKDHPFRVLINGQNGKIAGAAPFSGRKLALVAFIIIAIVSAIALAIVIASAGR